MGPSVSVALSGGGAAAFGHVPVLEALDDLGIRPAAIAGASMGAVLAAAYAAGMSGAEIRAHLLDMAASPLAAVRRFLQRAAFDPRKAFAGVDALAAVDIAVPEALPERIEDLPIPFAAVATDYHARRAHVFDAGPLRPALAASVSIPAIFGATRIDGRVYVDGGVTDNLPVAALPPSDLCLAVDVASEPPSDDAAAPSGLEAAIGAMRIMMKALLDKHLEARPDAILIQPASRRFGALDFDKLEEILAAAEPAREDARRRLGEALEAAARA
ncbi:MAG: patatin-like phospholipase family protein [Pseudomonadota bacterium]